MFRSLITECDYSSDQITSLLWRDKLVRTEALRMRHQSKDFFTEHISSHSIYRLPQLQIRNFLCKTTTDSHGGVDDDSRSLGYDAV